MSDTNRPKFAESLSSLSSDALERITWLMLGEGFSQLLLTGDRLLRAKLMRIRSVSISWENPSFCNWSACLPFVNSFSNLRELSLITPYPKHYTLEHLDLSTLPSTLESLDLRYACVLASFTNAFSSTKSTVKALNHLFPSLSSLFIEDLAEKEQFVMLDIASLPQTLRHLHLRNFVTTIRCLQGVTALPSELRTLSFVVSKDSAPEWRLPEHSDSLPSQLTHLAISVLDPDFILDIASVANSLNHLSTNSALSYNGRLLFNTEWEVPLRMLLPRLESLQLDRHITLDEFESLPLSVTKLEAGLRWKPIKESTRRLAGMNEEWRSKRGNVDCPFAPSLLRHFSSFPFKDDISDIICLFEGLDALNLPKAMKSIPAHVSLPPKLRSLAGVSLHTTAAQLPRSLDELTCQDILLPPQHSHSNQAPIDASQRLSDFDGLPRLSCLNLTVPLTVTLVSLLPSSLEKLDAIMLFEDAMEALTRRADVDRLLPRFRSLTLIGQLPPPSAEDLIPDDTLVLSRRFIPSSVTALTISGSYLFAPPGSSDSLNTHPRLQTLMSLTPQRFVDAMSNLSPSLLHLSLEIADPIDLNEPEAFEAVQHWPRKLKSLKLRCGDKLNNFFLPLERDALTPEMRRKLLAGRPDRRGLPSWLPGFTWSYGKIAVVCEDFILGCLPRSLSELQLDILAEGHFFGLRYKDNWLRNSIDLRFVNFGHFVQKTAIYRLPLLGLFFRPTTRNFEQDVIYDTVTGRQHITAPPLISSWTIASDRHRFVAVPQRSPHFTLSKAKPRDTSDKSVYTYRMLFQACNLIAWLVLDHIFPFTQQEHPIAYGFKWMNLIGLPLSIGLWGKRRLAAPSPSRADPRLLKEGSVMGGMWLALFIATGFFSAIGFGVTATTRGPVLRSLCFFAASLGELGIQWIAQRLF